MRNNKLTSLMVGLFAILGLVCLFFLGFKASSLGSFRPSNTYHVLAQFDDVSGLGKDAQVMLSGVQIGRVLNIYLAEDKRGTVVDMEIDRSVQLPIDSSAQILTSGLLGERYIGIEYGQNKEMLKDGDALARTGGSLVLEKMLQQFLGSDGGYNPAQSYTLTANFNDISGLSLDAAVTQSGVQIGRVTRIYLDQERFQAVVEMEIDASFNKIPSDSSADILSRSLIGGKYIGITPGGDTHYLEDGDTFQYSNSSIVIERVIQQFISNMTMSK